MKKLIFASIGILIIAISLSRLFMQRLDSDFETEDHSANILVVTDTIYVYSGPGQNYDTIGILIEDDSVEILQSQDSWIELVSGGYIPDSIFYNQSKDK